MMPTSSPELADLVKAEREYRAVAAEAEQLRLERNAAVRAALEHHTHAEIAQATGLTRGRVGQLAVER